MLEKIDPYRNDNTDSADGNNPAGCDYSNASLPSVGQVSSSNSDNTCIKIWRDDEYMGFDGDESDVIQDSRLE